MERPAPPSTEARAEAVWARALERARHDLPESAFSMWFGDVRARRIDQGALELTVPSDYVKARLTGHYMDLVQRAVSEANGEPMAIRLIVGRRDRTQVKEVAEVPSGPGRDIDERYTFETFVLGPSNKFAHAAAMAVAEAPPSTAYNPLFIYGGVGLGKTHLLYAIAHHAVRLAPSLRAQYVTSERFVTEFIRAVRERQGYQFQRRYRDVDVLLVDDIQFLAGKEETQTEFFHTFNALHGSRRQLVIASDRPPQELTALEERLRNRFEWGLRVDVQPPDLETRVAILQMKALRDRLHAPDDVLHFIAEKFDSNIRELEGALLRVAAFGKLSNLRIDLPLAERALEDLLPLGNQDITPEIVLAETGRFFGVDRADLVSKSRSRPLTNARHVAMYLLRELVGLSLIKIGELFDRDHTTALHGIKKIEGSMPARDATFRQVQELTKIIKATAREAR